MHKKCAGYECTRLSSISESFFFEHIFYVNFMLLYVKKFHYFLFLLQILLLIQLTFFSLSTSLTNNPKARRVKKFLWHASSTHKKKLKKYASMNLHNNGAFVNQMTTKCNFYKIYFKLHVHCGSLLHENGVFFHSIQSYAQSC